jgi:DNA processing protein
MMDLISQAADLESRAVRPARELGAYEALWCQEGATFKTLAAKFRAQPDSVPSDFVAPAEAERYARMALGTIREAGIRHFGVRVQGAGEYPGRLLDAEHPVALLYFQGNWDITTTRCIAIVGTRRPSEEGIRRAAKLARNFVQDNFTVVSGLAQGIDTIAHTTAIEAGGRTVAVLGTPITFSYPPENAALQRRIADEFPERNATMSALTEATVIVEAGNTSGTLVQARHALQQGRRLFILDSCFQNPGLTWPHKFLERGAVRVKDYDELRSHFAT